jgi:3-dehydroquinate dehydratase/shikimate dehydrogenase
VTSKVILVASLTARPEGGELSLLSGVADILEVRADLVGDIEPDWLRDRFSGQLLFTLRSRAEGGSSEASSARRYQRLAEAAHHYDLVDLEGLRDLHPELLAAVPEDRRIISWHGPPSSFSDLTGVFERLSAEGARYYKLVPGATEPRHALSPLALLNSLQRDDVIAFASDAVGAWTRLISPRLGAPLVYGSVTEMPAAAGQPSIVRLQRDFGLPGLPEVERLNGLVGCPVAHSLSPALHNGLYRRLGLPALYLPFHVEAFGDFWLDIVESGSLQVLGLDLRGLSVTAPHKGAALAVAGAASPLAETVGAANTLTWNQGVWEAENTDPEGIMGALASRRMTVDGLSAAVLGAGGAGRAAVFSLSHAGARVVLFNRGVERGRRMADQLQVPFTPLAELDPSRFDLLIHATALGRDEEDELPFDPRFLHRDTLVVDLVYKESGPTRLVEEVRAHGVQAIDGRELLLHQAVSQFRLMTGEELPLEDGREILGLEDGV